MSDTEKIENCAVISTALPVEYLAVAAHLSNLREVRHEAGTIYEVGKFIGQGGRWEVALVQTGQGNPRAAFEIERAISFFNPSHVFFIGVAGGLKDVKLGDVVAASKVYGYEYGKANAVFSPRADFGESTYSMIQEATFVARRGEWLSRVRLNDPSDMFGETPHAFVGAIAAGEKVVASTASDVYKFLRENFSDALAVEMESYGFFRAIHANTNVQALVVRGISDTIDHKAAADGSGSQERASAHAAAFVYEVLARIIGVDRSKNTQTAETKYPNDFWNDLEALAITLYPYGPGQDDVWSRAGGDMSQLTLRASGKGDWHAALRTLRLGGGGSKITPPTLLRIMTGDYPANEELKCLANVHAEPLVPVNRKRPSFQREKELIPVKDESDSRLRGQSGTVTDSVHNTGGEHSVRQLRIVRIVVASPSDVQAERTALQKVTEELNRGIAADRGLHLSLSRWETDSYPGFHPEGPQGLIDPLLRIQDCDILIGIFWKRFGTPTKGAQSGTEHEFRTAYEAWSQNRRPEIMVYFNQKPYTPKSPDEAIQWSKVLEFQQRFPKEGLWWPYKNKTSFVELVRNHLTQLIRMQFPIAPTVGVVSRVDKVTNPSLIVSPPLQRRPEPPPGRDMNDPQKGRWGGEAERGGRKLEAYITGKTKTTIYVNLEVSSTDGTELIGPVFFHLHDSFARSVISIRKIRNKSVAILEDLNTQGVFTIGAQVMDKSGNWIGLEFDLAQLPGLPEKIKKS